MEEFLNFFLHYHLGTILFFSILFLTSLHNFVKNLFAFMDTYFLDEEEYTKNLLEIVNTGLMPLVLLLFIIFDFSQPNDIMAKLIYFIISIGILLVLLSYIYHQKYM